MLFISNEEINSYWDVVYPRFEEHIRQYDFYWMMKALGKYNKELVQEFYAAYKGEHQRQYP